MSGLWLFKRNTNILKRTDKSNSYSFDYQKNSYIFMGISGGYSLPPHSYNMSKEKRLASGQLDFLVSLS